MDGSILNEPRVYILGDNDVSLNRFQQTLGKEFGRSVIRLTRTQMLAMTEGDICGAKFVLVMPNSPRQIIYDESHCARSFHVEIQKAAGSGRDSVLIVVYASKGPPRGKLVGDEVELLYRSGQQPHLKQFTDRNRLMSLENSSGLLSPLQREEIGLFLKMPVHKVWGTCLGWIKKFGHELWKNPKPVGTVVLCLAAINLVLWLYARRQVDDVSMTAY